MALTKKYTEDVRKAMHCAESGSAYHWPTIAAILADEVKRLENHLQEIRGHHHGDDAYNIASDALGIAR